MGRLVEIICENNGIKKMYPLGTSLTQIIEDQNISLKYPILGAYVNNELEELTHEIFRPKTIRFIDITSTDGLRMYTRSLSFIMIKAVHDLFPFVRLKIKHPISKGYFCTFDNADFVVDMDTVFRIVERMREIVRLNLPFRREEVLMSDAITLFEELKFYEKADLFKTRPKLYTSLYYLDDAVDYFYGYLVPSTGYITHFDVAKYYDGMILMLPRRDNPEEIEEIVKQDKMFDIFKEHKDWGEVLGVNTVASINKQILSGKAGELIKISEALHEKKVVQIADMIHSKLNKIRVILISGPSSSGKTTFTMRLAVQLKVAGIKTVQISLDNYFVAREETPRDEKGEFDFEALEALDVELFNQNLLQLLAGEVVEIPRFSFSTGNRYYDGTTMKMNSDEIILIEGIHALNPKLTYHLPSEIKFKVYVSALTQVGIDWHNRIPTTDNRLIRRMIRDYKYRNYSALETLRRWESVRRGEDRNIFPYQEEADVMFNSALLFELGVLKRYAEPLLYHIPQNVPEYSEALRLLKFLSYFAPVPDEEVPPTSIFREFLGNSSFKYT